MVSRGRVSGGIAEPVLAPELVERVLAKLGLHGRPVLDLAGLNTLYAAFCGNIPFDNIRKRVWFASDRTTPLPGGDPSDFFQNWLAHGTGGTCWPINGGMYALVHALGFEARRIAGEMIFEGSQPTNHGSVIVTIDGTDHLVDANIGSFKVLKLVLGIPASTGDGIHDISAVPIEAGFEVIWYPGHNRKEPVPFRPERGHDPVDHAFFLTHYERSKSSQISPFNAALYISRRFPDSILTVGRNKKITVAADGGITTTQITDLGRKAVLIEELGISQEIVEALPPDVTGASSFF